jgi:hypothetical protein
VLQRTFRGSIENAALNIWHFEWCSSRMCGKQCCCLAPVACLGSMVSWNLLNWRDIDATAHHCSRERFCGSMIDRMPRRCHERMQTSDMRLRNSSKLTSPCLFLTLFEEASKRVHDTTINHRDDVTQHNTTIKINSRRRKPLAMREYICALNGHSQSSHSRLYLRFE